MSYEEKWNLICKLYKENCSKKEEIVQTKWEGIFNEIFGYSQLRNEIDTKRYIQLGSKRSRS